MFVHEKITVGLGPVYDENIKAFQINTEPIHSKFLDWDGDGLDYIEEQEFGTDPWDADSDHDGLHDYEEIYLYDSNPLSIDSDGDFLPDLIEVVNRTDANNPDTDGDLLEDGFEVLVLGTSFSSADTNGDNISDLELYLGIFTGIEQSSLQINYLNDWSCVNLNNVPLTVHHLDWKRMLGYFYNQTTKIKRSKKDKPLKKQVRFGYAFGKKTRKIIARVIQKLSGSKHISTAPSRKKSPAMQAAKDFLSNYSEFHRSRGRKVVFSDGGMNSNTHLIKLDVKELDEHGNSGKNKKGIATTENEYLRLEVIKGVLKNLSRKSGEAGVYGNIAGWLKVIFNMGILESVNLHNFKVADNLFHVEVDFEFENKVTFHFKL